MSEWVRVRSTASRRLDDCTIRVHVHRPVHQIQIEVVQPQILQTQLQVLLDPVGVRAPQLGRHEEVLPRHDAGVNGLADSLADSLLVLVAEGRVDVAVAHFDGVKDCILDFFGGRLPGS